ncbi:PhzF family phenazine biosynthesis protein [Nocardioides sp. Root151]|uniref:PhzF family phenazine biosynthesis protein n=1 Tax=Nocardioides sp. Root151 TaxID=1736475 RepID=UPI000702B5CC|nr:PhzF family phenazine biosynthesis protein [Nocardioides sp. Root151]KQZ68610.1 phenazine biosynthesis protein PhzF [Nocardioides sp. Root151]
MTTYDFSQVDVFAPAPLTGNPVAVVHDATGLTDEQMAAFARWTNLSETTFLLPPTDPRADYRLRIFTPSAELPFAGHPTLGSAHAWLEIGGTPASSEMVVQECGIGLVELRRDGDVLAFRAPGFLRSGEVDQDTLDHALSALGVAPERVRAVNWIDNGPGWMGLLLDSADDVLALTPDYAAIGDLDLGVIGPHAEGGPADYEVRAFCPELAVPEDPVTGSLNAGFAVWLIGAGLAASAYTVRQGTALGRSGDVRITTDESGDQWVGGAARTLIRGTLTL